jgi:SAM-dependent methyltransferase
MTPNPTSLHRPYSDARPGHRLAQWRSLVASTLRSPDDLARIQLGSFERLRPALEQALGRPARGLSMLEIGCGQWQTLSNLFSALGNDVVGLDPELPPSHPLGYVGFAREVGLERAGKSFVRQLLLRGRFDAALGRRTGLPVEGFRAMLVRRGVERLPAVDGATDAVVSDNVFEHLPDVPGALREIARVLRPGGLVVLGIHPFTALSGGHHPGSIHHGDTAGWAPSIPPWDHLREARHPSGVFLNRLRPADYRAAAESHFETVTWTTYEEGRAILDREAGLEQELAARGFARDEVLTGRILYVGRKPGLAG